MKSGIYEITFVGSDKRYIGSSNDVKRRISGHMSKLRHNNHGNAHLQCAFNKYGEDSIMINTIEEVSPELLLEVEDSYLKNTLCEYNIFKYALRPNLVNGTLPDEVKAKLREAWKTRPPATDETRARISRSNAGRKPSELCRARLREEIEKNGHPAKKCLGRHHSEEARRKISEANTGKKMSAERRAQNSACHMGVKLSSECKEKLRIANMGHTVSLETRAKISAGHLGKKQSAERRAQNSACHMGIKLSSEAIAKRSNTVHDNSVARKANAELAKSITTVTLTDGYDFCAVL